MRQTIAADTKVNAITRPETQEGKTPAHNSYRVGRQVNKFYTNLCKLRVRENLGFYIFAADVRESITTALTFVSLASPDAYSVIYLFSNQ